MSKYLDENGLLYLWEKITDAIDPKADKVPEVNHGTSDTTFTLTPNIMHIWGEIATLNLTLSADSNSVLDEYMFTFTCPSDAATNLTLPSSIKWILQPELLAGKTYQVSIVNGLAGYLTDDMPATGQDNIIETVKVNGTALTPDANKAVDITVPQGTVTSVTVNGSNYTPDTNGLVNLGTISGESGTGGEYNVIEGVTFNGTTAPITNKIAAITYTAPTLSKGTTTGSGNAVTDISVSGHTVTLTKGSTFLTSYTETDPTVPAAVKAITATDISNWNAKAADSGVVHLAGAETITGNKVIQDTLYFGDTNKSCYIKYLEPGNGAYNLFLSGNDEIYLDSVTDINGGLYLLTGDQSEGGIFAPSSARSDTKVWNTNGTITDLTNYQAALVSGTNIKTINNLSLLGSGNITISGASGGEANVIESVKVNGTALTVTNKAVDITAVPASIVTQDATHRFVSDTEKSTWNSKANSSDLSSYLPLSGGKVTGSINFASSGDEYDTYVSHSAGSLILKGEDGITAIGDFTLNGDSIYINSGGALHTDSIIAYTTGNRSNTKVFNTNGGIIDLPSLSKGTTTGSGNAVTDISVSGHTITLTKGTEFLTTGASSDDILYDPSSSASTSTIGPGLLTTCLEDIDDALDAKQNTSDKVTSISSSSTNTQYPSALAVYNYGQTLTSSLTTIYSGSSTPASSLGSNGDIYIKTS